MKTPTSTQPLFGTGAGTPAEPRVERGAEAFSRAVDAAGAEGRSVTLSLDGGEARLSLVGTLVPSSATGRSLLANRDDGSVSVWTPRGGSETGLAAFGDYDITDPGRDTGRAPSLFATDDAPARGVGIRLDRAMLFARAAHDGSGYDLYLLDGRSRLSEPTLRGSPEGLAVEAGASSIGTVPTDVLAKALGRLDR